MSADNIFQQRHTEESVYDVDHLPYSLLYEQPQAPVQSSHTVHPYGPVNQQTQYQFVYMDLCQSFPKNMLHQLFLLRRCRRRGLCRRLL